MKQYENVNFNKCKKEYHYVKPSCGFSKPSCHHNCEDECTLECYPCHENPCKNPNSFPSDCCTLSMRDALKAIAESVCSSGKSSLVVDVNLYTINGGVYPISFSKSNLCNIEITKEAIVYNCEAISLNSIVRIELLTSSLSSQFKESLLNRLVCLTEACENPYLAYTLDEESVCPRCHKAKCNCKCSNTLGNFIDDNAEDLQSASYSGNTNPTFVINDTTSTNVVSDVNTSVGTIEVLENARLNTTSTNVVSSVNLQSTQIIDNIITDTQEVVTDINQNTQRVISSVSITPVTVVNNVSQDTAEVVENIYTNTQTIDVVTDFSQTQVVKNINQIKNEGITDLEFDETSVVEDIDTELVNVVESIDQNTTTVVASVSPRTKPAVSSVDFHTTEVVNNVSFNSSSIISATDPQFINAITNIETESTEIYQDLSTETGSAVTDIKPSSKNVVTSIDTDDIDIIENVTLDYDSAIKNIQAKTTSVVKDVNFENSSFVSDINADKVNVLISSDNHSAVDNVLYNINTDTNTQSPKTVVVGNSLGNGALKVSADNIPVSMEQYNTILVNQLNNMITTLNNILKKCCYSSHIRSKHNHHGNEFEKGCYCQLLPLFDVNNLLQSLNFDLNENVTINGSPVNASGVTISVFDDSTQNYIHNIDNSFLVDNVFAGFNPDENIDVVSDIEKQFENGVSNLSTTTVNAVNRVTYANVSVVNAVDFITSTVQQVRNISTTNVLSGFTLSTDTFVKDVELVDSVEVITAVNTFSDSVVSSFDNTIVDIVTDIHVGTTDVVSNIDAATDNYVNKVTSTNKQVLESIDVNSLDVVESVNYDTTSVLSDADVTTDRFVTNVSDNKASVVSNLDINSIEIIEGIDVDTTEVVSEVNTEETLVNSVDNTRSTTVVTSIVPVSEDVEFITSISTDTLVSVRNVTAVPVIDSANLQKSTTEVVNSLDVNPEFTSVVESVNGEYVNMLSPSTPRDLDAADATAGNGLLVVDENSGNISVYSVCKIDSVQTNCK